VAKNDVSNVQILGGLFLLNPTVTSKHELCFFVQKKSVFDEKFYKRPTAILDFYLDSYSD